ncbi:hypothetical protein JBE04_02640 [Streptomyces sp. PRKS01-29]|nr:hypothetical protein [Streptomyces sabulosicollis]MBI0293416.1 hypothetical protein [Streptomyces sabulosicollis]
MTGSPEANHWPDPAPDPAPTRRPGHITAAAVLLVVSAFISATIAVNDPEMTQFVYLLLFVTVGAALRLRGGGRAARATATVTAVLFLVYLLPHATRGFSAPGGTYQPEYAVRALLAIAVSATGLTLLHAPGSRAYFRTRRQGAERAARDRGYRPKGG